MRGQGTGDRERGTGRCAAGRTIIAKTDDRTIGKTTTCAPSPVPCPLETKKPRSSRGPACRRSPVLRKRKGGNVVRSRQRDLDHLQLRHRLLVARGLVVT